MLIAGWQKVTLVDYPDKIATMIFTPGCNLRCRFCHNPNLVLPDRIVLNSITSEQDFFEFLERRSFVLDGVVICGGEPTLQSDLLFFCEKIKKLTWLAIKLDTNGRDPMLVGLLIDKKLIDYVAMDIKCHEAQRLSLLQSKEKIHPYLETIALLKNWSLDYELRTTMIKGWHTKENFLDICKIIQGSKRYVLQQYRKGDTIDPLFDGESFASSEMDEFVIQWSEWVRQCLWRE